MNRRRHLWLNQPHGPTDRGVFEWVAQPQRPSLLCGLVVGVYDGDSCSIACVQVGTEHLNPPEHLARSGMSAGLVQSVLAAAPMPVLPGMNITIEVFEPDVLAIAVVLEEIPT